MAKTHRIHNRATILHIKPTQSTANVITESFESKPPNEAKTLQKGKLNLIGLLHDGWFHSCRVVKCANDKFGWSRNVIMQCRVAPVHYWLRKASNRNFRLKPLFFPKINRDILSTEIKTDSYRAWLLLICQNFWWSMVFCPLVERWLLTASHILNQAHFLKDHFKI